MESSARNALPYGFYQATGGIATPRIASPAAETPPLSPVSLAGEGFAAPAFAGFHNSAAANAKDKPTLAEASSIIQQKIAQLGSGAKLAEVGR